ncbi:hypothetical protein Tsubulata_033424 [Turnera subulata]|uniref:1-phosphatidylinositol 4-kinase n=1 Tax=Turnera subulata TaxID=218843 RepID=A0A9Q0FB88_9ROSI|nr:hypothetical protein Tsubulata_033424 [Turnera subulata]
MAVAIDQHHGFKPFNRSQRCRLQSLTHLDFRILELTQTQTQANNLANSFKQAFEVANIHKSSSTPCFSLVAGVEEQSYTKPRVEILRGSGAPRIRALVAEVAIGIASGVDPVPVSNGLGGVYLLHNRNGDKIAVTKPADEEPLALNNPKGFGGLMLGQPGVKRSIRVGETGVRELAAFLLDHGGFAGIPPTALVKISHVEFHINADAAISPPPYKIASLQRFIDHDFDAGELGPSSFSVASVHRIGIFDVRLLNLDRHAGNILVKKNNQCETCAVVEAELVPIDHGLCLPEWLDDPYFEWLHWPQASIPFSEAELEYIGNLDPFKDAELLRKELPSLRESCIRVLILCTIFLKGAAAAGLCLADIGKMMTRDPCVGEETMSALENLCSKAKTSLVDMSRDDGCSNNDTERSIGNEDMEVFQLDDGNGDASGEGLYLPQLSLGKPPKVPRVSSERNMSKLQDATVPSLNEEKDPKEEDTVKDNGDENDEDKNKVGGLKRSVSYAVDSALCEPEGISLEDLGEDEFEQFLVLFEMLLPEVFDGAKSTCSKLRLGTSCEF